MQANQNAAALNNAGAAAAVSGLRTDHLVDKEVADVIMKGGSSRRGNRGGGAGAGGLGGGYALPADDDDAAAAGHDQMDDMGTGDDDYSDEDGAGGGVADDDPALQEDDDDDADDDGMGGDDDGDEMEDVGEDEEEGDVEQQIVNITAKEQQQKQEDEEAQLVMQDADAAQQQQNNDAILVIYNQQQQQQQLAAQQEHAARQRQIQSANLPQKPHSAGYAYQYQYEQGRQNMRSSQMPRRNVAGQVGPTPPQNFMPQQAPQQQAQSQDALKRKKLREMIFGVKQHQNAAQMSYYNRMQKEDIQNHYRNLKITNNITRDENVRLKTKLQQIQYELNQRDKELEKLTLRLQQNLTSEIKGMPVSHGNFTESFLVAQLKRSARDLKLEVQEKDRLIEQLKRNIKLSKTQEIEVELTVYIEECLRLRAQLEQAQLERQILAQQQQPGSANVGDAGEQLASLEEAFRYQELELQREREQSRQLHEQLVRLQQEQHGKMKEKTAAVRTKSRKVTELERSNKRQANMMTDKVKENNALRSDLGQLRAKLAEREKVHKQNTDLVTKNCAQQSNIERLKRKCDDLQKKSDELQAQLNKPQAPLEEYVPRVYKQHVQKQATMQPLVRQKSPVRTIGKAKEEPATMQLRASNQAASSTSLKAAVQIEPKEKENMPPIAQIEAPKKKEAAPAQPAEEPIKVEAVAEVKAAAPAEVSIQRSEKQKTDRSAKVQEIVEDEKNESASNKEYPIKNTEPTKDDPIEASDRDAAPSEKQQKVESAREEEPRMLSMSKGQQDLNKESGDGIVVGAGDDNAASSRKDQKSIDYTKINPAEVDDSEDDDPEKRNDILREMAEYEHNFFFFPYEAQEVLFMMVKGDNEGLSNSKLYCQDPDQFNFYFQSVVQFSQEFDPTDTLMHIARDPNRIQAILDSPDEPVPLAFIVNELWPKIGFLPDPSGQTEDEDLLVPGFELVAEFMLNELILKYSESLDKCVLVHLKELFSGDGGEVGMDDEELDEIEAEAAHEEMKRLAEARAAQQAANDDDDYSQDDIETPSQQAAKATKAIREQAAASSSSRKPSSRAKGKKSAAKDSDDYSSDKNSDSSDGGNMFLDINDLRRRNEGAEDHSDAASSKRDKKKKGNKKKQHDDDGYDDDEFI